LRTAGIRRKPPLFVITGASGTGKSTVALGLAVAVREWRCLDADALWRPEYDHPEDGYQTFRSLALRAASAISSARLPVVLLSGGTPEQFETSPERHTFGEVHYLALVCDDDVLIRRLKARPPWRMSAARGVIEQERSFNQWLREKGPHTVPPMTLVDTSDARESKTVQQVVAWIRARWRRQ
jgi:shikimate kinase